LAQSFMERIVGLRAGEVVFDGPPSDLSEDALTEIYGAEDWNTMRREDDDEDNTPLDVAQAAEVMV